MLSTFYHPSSFPRPIYVFSHCLRFTTPLAFLDSIIGWLLLVGWCIVFPPTCWKIWWLIGVLRRARFQTRTLASFRQKHSAPLFILRHLRHAAKKLKPRNSPRLHVALIDFLQAYDTVPRQQLWSHLRRSAMPSTLLSVINHMYENDEYILMDGEKRARVYPTNGVKQGCPLSPLLFSLYINDMGRELVRALRVPWLVIKWIVCPTCCMLMTLD